MIEEIKIESPFEVRYDRDWDQRKLQKVIKKLRLIHPGFRLKQVQTEPYTNWVSYESMNNVDDEVLGMLTRLTSRYEYLIRKDLGVALVIRRGK